MISSKARLLNTLVNGGPSPEDQVGAKTMHKIDYFLLDRILPDNGGVEGLTLYVSGGGEFENGWKLGPRLMVALGVGRGREAGRIVATISVGKSPVLMRGRISAGHLDRVQVWIKLNLPILLRHWSGRQGSCEFLDLIRSIEDARMPP